MAYLVKPIRGEQLASSISVAVRRFEQFQELASQAADLKHALEDRKLIERAKGVLMSHRGLSEDDAFRRLQKLASDRNQKLVDVARAILASYDEFERTVGG